MRYRISGDGWSEEYRVRRVPPLGFQFDSASGDALHLSAEAVDGDRVFRVVVGDRTHILTVLPGNRPGQTLRFLFDDEYFELDVKSEIDLLEELLGHGGHDSGRQEIRSVMPGVVRKVLVAEGDSVELEAPVLILEAMKMENEIRSPVAGSIQSIAVAEGVTVAAGELLAVIDKEG